MAVAAHTDPRVRFADRGELSKPDVSALAEYTAQQLLGVSADEAFRMLDRGELDGKSVEWTFRALRRLLNAR